MGKRKWYGKNWIRPDKRLAIHIRDRFTCMYCARQLFDAEPGELTLDHYVPVDDGGTNGAGNVLTACASCNYSKGKKSAEAYFYVLGMRRGLAGAGLHDFISGGLARARFYLSRPLNRRLAKVLIDGKPPTLFDSLGDAVCEHVASDPMALPPRA